ncbi:hypothetical protein ABZ990_14635 [Streptomyces sp. NPDC046203]|uniref:hypothetical protein n=1 Tax=Streptomyces sp. NPDC046203 TaxID=3154602 RepID=UPI0033C913A1
MHRTRTTVTFLAGMAMAALSGCVAVEPVAPRPAPAASAGPAGGEAVPQIVPGPAREALEAAMPDPPEPEPQSSLEKHAEDDGKHPAHRHPPAHAHPGHPPAARPHRPPAAPVRPPELPESRSDVCRLGAVFGGWSSDSAQARICRNTYAK